ncbi:hypothetical protein Tco_0522819 [Tanacetum coccineum]
MMDEDKETDEVRLSTEDEVSTAKEGVSTDFEKVSTDRPKLSTDDLKILEGSEDQWEVLEEKLESTPEQKESTKEQIRKILLLKLLKQSTQNPLLDIWKFEDIQALYEKIKRFNEHFISTGSAKDERLIKRLNEKRGGLSKSEVIKEEQVRSKDEDKDEESTRKGKLGFERVLWVRFYWFWFNPDEQDEFWNSQHEWKIISWKLHSSSGIHTLVTNEGVVIHMLTEKKYPLKKEILVQMLNLRLESEEESTMALELIRFIKKAAKILSVKPGPSVPINTPLIGTIRQTPDHTKSLQELVSKKTRIEEVFMVKVNA